MNNHVDSALSVLLRSKAHTAIKYVSPHFVVRATRRLERGKVPRRGPVEIVLTIGRPNYLERKFIKDCVRARERFPVKKVQLKFPPVRRKPARRRLRLVLERRRG